MGCSATKLNTNGGSPSNKDILSRIESPKSVRTMSHCGLEFKYAWMSQRGYYPEDLDKDNQDAYSITTTMDRDIAFFAVYDGHGRDGHLCSRYVRDKVPKIYRNIFISLLIIKYHDMIILLFASS